MPNPRHRHLLKKGIEQHFESMVKSALTIGMAFISHLYAASAARKKFGKSVFLFSAACSE
jgi:hypothetical protein